MLWNPKHDRMTVDAVAYDLPMIVAFLKTKKSKERYDYADCEGKCLYSQYMIWLGYRADHTDPDVAAFMVWAGLNRMYGDISATRPWTCGAALKRAEKRMAVENW